MLTIVIGTKAWSSWSMRPWLALKHTGAPFTETLVTLRQYEQSAAEIARYSPTGLVPVLKADELVIWDSLAICEWLAERFPQAALWPADDGLRALGRSMAAEMHAGFAALRQECPMDLFHRQTVTLSSAAQADVRRLATVWTEALARSDGPFLLGAWSIADAFFTPVATRFRTYGIALDVFGDRGLATAYADRLLKTPEYLAWEAGAA